MNVKEICAKDNILQKSGKYKSEEIKNIHKLYSQTINEEELLSKLMSKYKKG